MSAFSQTITFPIISAPGYEASQNNGTLIPMSAPAQYDQYTQEYNANAWVVEQGTSCTVSITADPAYPPQGEGPIWGGIDAGQGSGVTITQQVPYPMYAGHNNPITFTVGVQFPNYVTEGTLSLYMRNSLEASTLNIPYYVVHIAPQSPQSQPFLGVLNDGCAWAAGASSTPAVQADLTKGLYYAERFAYPLSTRSNFTDQYLNFLLTKFLGTPGYVSGNCVDVSDYLCIVSNALGMSDQVTQYSDVMDQGFTTNPVCLVGSDPTILADYTVSTWGIHQFIVASGGVYDACAAQLKDLSGNGYENPPLDWPLDGYWQTAPSLGLVASPNPSSPLVLLGPYTPTISTAMP